MFTPHLTKSIYYRDIVYLQAESNNDFPAYPGESAMVMTGTHISPDLVLQQISPMQNMGKLTLQH
jgi:hypothetical protein